MKFLPALLILLLATAAQAAPKADLWPVWQVNNPASTQIVDHGVWDHFLQTYLRTNEPDGINRVAYAQVPAAEQTALADDIKRLEAVHIDDYAPAEQRAYWMDLYNEETVLLILQHMPVKSILDIDLGGGGLFSRGPWDAKLLTIEGRPVSLNDIEHRIIRPIWPSPLNHYGLNCASLGCPNLMPQAFTAANFLQLLQDNARAYINNPAHVAVTADGLSVSNIYIWYQSDFGGTEQGVIDHLMQYAAPALKQQLAGIHTISSHHYDWDLNIAS
jgi:hypothetical protein